jgi:hypothetical protein
LTGMQQPDISSVDGSFVRFEGRVVAAAGILQWCGPPVSLPVAMQPSRPSSTHARCRPRAARNGHTSKSGQFSLGQVPASEAAQGQIWCASGRPDPAMISSHELLHWLAARTGERGLAARPSARNNKSGCEEDVRGAAVTSASVRSELSATSRRSSCRRRRARASDG